MNATPQEPAQAVNVVEIETLWGVKAFELYEADITRLGTPVDLLILSAFAGSYAPTPGTVIEAFQAAYGVEIAQLAQSPWLDLRTSLGCWISAPLPEGPCKRVMGVELLLGALDIADVLANVFVSISVMELKGVSPKTVALPVLGAGCQGLAPEEVLSVVLPKAVEYLKRSPSVERILFVEKNRDRVDCLNQKMNAVLGRIKMVMPKGPLIASVRSEILQELNADLGLPQPTAEGLFKDIRRVVSNEASRSYEIGVLARRLVETVVDRVLGSSKEIDLYQKVENTGQFGVAPWIRSYLHVLRVFGNESVHERAPSGRRPETIREADLGLCLFCMLRILAFNREYRHGVLDTLGA